jgi:hypothetical protein
MALQAVSKFRRGDEHLDVLTDLHEFLLEAREIPTSGAASAKVYVMPVIGRGTAVTYRRTGDPHSEEALGGIC